MTRRADARQPSWQDLLGLAVLLFCLTAAGPVAWADAPCTKSPDLWFPPPGTLLSNSAISVQEATAAVCQGGKIQVTITVDNLTCGDAGPFDIGLYYDADDPGHLIASKHVDGLIGCEHVTLTFSWNTAAVAPGWHTLIAWADKEDAVSELNEANNQYLFPAQVLISPNAPLIDATKTYVDVNGGVVSPMDRIRYEIVIRNDGCAGQADNPGHELFDPIPIGMAATGTVAATSGSATVDGSAIVWDGAIPARASVTITYEVTVNADVLDSTQICNQALVAWDSNKDGANDASEPSDDPSTSEADDDPTCLTVQIMPELPVVTGTIDAPTLSEWGAIALGVLFGISFLLMLERRRRLGQSARKGAG